MDFLINGLQGYEVVLMILGVILFAVLLLDLIIKVVKNRSYNKTLLGMGVPVLFIGFSSYTKIQVGKDLFSLEKSANEVSEHPGDTVRVQSLTDKLKTFNATRVENDASGLTTVSKAYLAAGDFKQGKLLLSKAKALGDDDPAVIKNQQILLAEINQHEKFVADVTHLRQNIAKARTEAGNTKLSTETHLLLSSLPDQKVIDEADKKTIAEAYATIGHPAEAQTVGSSLFKNRESPSAISFSQKLTSLVPKEKETPTPQLAETHMIISQKAKMISATSLYKPLQLKTAFR